MGLSAPLDLAGRPVLFVQCAQSQLDACFYAELSQRRPGAVLVAILNDGGAKRQEIDPELGLVPQFPDLEIGFSTVHFPGEKSGGLKGLLNLIFKLRPRLVVVQDQSWVAKLAISIVTRLLGGRVAMRSDKNFMSHNARSGIARWLECRLVGLSFDFLAPVSDLTRDYYDWRRMDRILPFPYPTSAKKFKRNALADGVRSRLRKLLEIPADSPVFLVVAKFVERENVAAAIAGFASVAASAENAHLIVVGAGPLEAELKEMARRLHPARVHFMGYMPYDQLHEVFWASDIFVHLATIEPWGVSPQDALVAGMKLVTSSRVGSGLVHLQGRMERFLVQGDDPVDAGAVMRLALDSPPTVFEPAWRTVDASFTAEGLSDAWADFLR